VPNVIDILVGVELLFIGMFFCGSCFLVYREHLLMKYLKEHNYERWRELTSFGKYGPGLRNSFKALPYINGSQDNQIQEILRLKDSIKIFQRYAVSGFFASLINILLIVYVAQAIQK